VLTPTRLTLARKRRGMTLSRLEKATGITTRSLSAYENGHQQPSPQHVEMLASALAVPIPFLTATEVDEIPVDAISFRALSKMTASQRDAARSAARLAIMINDWIEDRFRLPALDLPTLPGHNPESAAERVRARWGLGESPISNMIHLLEAHGVRVFSLAEECVEVDAFSFYWKGTPFIFLNTLKSGERGRFDAAHECAHLVLDSEHVIPHGPEAEQRANSFASAFLMPQASVFAQRLHNAAVDRILAGKQVFSVSAMSLNKRLYELSLITDWGYRSNAKNLARLGYRRTEPDGIPRESSQLLTKVFASLRADGVTAADIASDLNLTVDEINNHVFGLVLTGLRGGSAASQRARPGLHLVKNLCLPGWFSRDPPGEATCSPPSAGL
jgi:Zn-dependent peptidase ImmA (M78 family)/DNA-binding XRE family transcriptional regulator